MKIPPGGGDFHFHSYQYNARFIFLYVNKTVYKNKRYLVKKNYFSAYFLDFFIISKKYVVPSFGGASLSGIVRQLPDEDGEWIYY